MDYAIVFMGSVGSGKTQAIGCISDVPVVDTEADATDATALLKNSTTVAMDMGVIALSAHDKVRLLGSPGQDRFNFMWDILLDQCQGVVLLIDHSREFPLQDFLHYSKQIALRSIGRKLPMVVGLTHTDMANGKPIDLAAFHRCHQRLHPEAKLQHHPLPIFEVDARCQQDVKVLLMALTAMLDMDERFPERAATPAAYHHA